MSARHPIQPTRDAVCLAAYLDGWTTQELADTCSVSPRTMARWLGRAKNNVEPPDLELWMSGAGKACPHSKPIVRGMPVLCLDCLQTGLPSHPAFRRGAPIGAPTETTQDSPAEIAATVQPTGAAKFRPKAKQAKIGPS